MLKEFRVFNQSLIAAGMALTFTSCAFGQSRQVPAPQQTQAIVIHGGTVHTVSGEAIRNGYVVFIDGVITAVGEGAPPRVAGVAGAQQVDASGMHVYPGLIASESLLGLVETGSVPVTIDHTEFGRITPEVRAAVAVNPDSDLLPVARSNGILTAFVTPRGGLISGRGSLMRLDGWTWEDMAIEQDVGLLVNWPRTEPIDAWWMERSEEDQRREIAEDLESIERIFDEAMAYLAAKDNDETQRTDLRYEGMRAAMAGEKPVFVRASSMGQIESAIAWGDRRGLKIIIIGGAEADRVIPLLKKHDVPVIITGTHRLPSQRHTAHDQPFTLPLKLHEAGVRWCLASGAEPAHERNLNHMAATAAAYGLSPIEALRGVTLHVANILGAGDTLGSIEVGKAATLIITTGDPLEILSDTLIAFIDGRRIDLGNRQSALYEKYKEKYRQLGLLAE